jgi:hypothetical protein
MRTDVNGKLDGNGIKRGDFTEGVTTILAPLVVGSKINSVARMTGDIVKPKIGNINIPVKVEVGTATTAEGLQIPVITTETKPLREVFGKPKESNVDKMRLPDMDEQINGNPIKENWKTKLGEGQDVDDLQNVNKVGAGMKAKPQHHVFPQEYRKFFEERGFVGQRSIDKFVVKLSDADHQAIHGGANWKLARKVWKDGEWNNKVINTIKSEEIIQGRKLGFEEIKAIVEKIMKDYGIPVRYENYRGGVK